MKNLGVGVIAAFAFALALATLGILERNIWLVLPLVIFTLAMFVAVFVTFVAEGISRSVEMHEPDH